MRLSARVFVVAIVVFIGSGADAGADCLPAAVPVIAVPPAAPRSHAFTVSWSGELALTPGFELQEATSESFGDAVTFAVSGELSKSIAAHSAIGVDSRYYYRVRGIATCSGQPGDYSRTASTVVTADQSDRSVEYSIGLPAGTTQPFVQDYLVPGLGEAATAGDRFLLTPHAP